MTLPGNRVPDHDGDSSIPAENVEQAAPPMFCRHSKSWSYVAGEGGWVCDDPEHHMDEAAATTLGDIPVEHQPTYTFPPNTNPAIQNALDAEDRQLQADAIQDRAKRLTRGW